VINNFVSIVGYQFERVHTGVISWLLDTKNTTVSLDIKYEIICRIHRICKCHRRNIIDPGAPKRK